MSPATIELAGFEVLGVLVEGDAKVLLRARAADDGRPVVIRLLRQAHPAAAAVARLEHEHAIAGDLPDAGFVRTEGVRRFGRRAGLVLTDVGGTVAIASTPGAGTTFTITIPDTAPADGGEAV